MRVDLNNCHFADCVYGVRARAGDEINSTKSQFTRTEVSFGAEPSTTIHSQNDTFKDTGTVLEIRGDVRPVKQLRDRSSQLAENGRPKTIVSRVGWALKYGENWRSVFGAKES